MGTGPNGRYQISVVEQYLLQRYQLPQGNFSLYKLGENCYLLKISTELNCTHVINEENNWGTLIGWWFDFYDCLHETYQQYIAFKVRITILNYPFVFWHPKFIRQVVSEFRELLSIDEINDTGNDRSSLNIWMKSFDANRLPFTTVLPFGDRWAQFRVLVMGWQYAGWVPLEARLNENDGQPLCLNDTFSQARFTLTVAQ